jgi:curli biogenesis system outer membrane secretion channel CsgG
MRSAAACVAFALVLSAHGQMAHNRVTVLPLKDRTNSGASLDISDKVADELMNQLTETGKYQVIDRENLKSLAAERGLKFDADFDPANAPKSGLVKLCDYLIVGQIDEFSQNATTTAKAGVFSKTAQTQGTVALKINIRLVSVETAQLVAAAGSRAEETKLLGESKTNNPISLPGSGPRIAIPATSSGSTPANVNSAMLALVDQDIAEVTKDVAVKIVAQAPSSAPAVASLPKFMGVVDGQAMISRGSKGGIKVGQTYQVIRSVKTGLVNPETGQPVMKHTNVCALTISSVDEDSSSGTCAGGVPVAGDELREVAP